VLLRLRSASSPLFLLGSSFSASSHQPCLRLYACKVWLPAELLRLKRRISCLVVAVQPEVPGVEDLFLVTSGPSENQFVPVHAAIDSMLMSVFWHAVRYQSTQSCVSAHPHRSLS
jgi:hypothetical protein